MSDHSVPLWNNKLDEQELHGSGEGYLHHDRQRRGPLAPMSMPSFPFRGGSNQRNNYACVNLIAHSELPLESDRKAVLGCFAAVLASVKAHAQCEFESRGGGVPGQKGGISSNRNSTTTLSAAVDVDVDNNNDDEDIHNDYSVATSSSSSSVKEVVEEEKEVCSPSDNVSCHGDDENASVLSSAAVDTKKDNGNGIGAIDTSEMSMDDDDDQSRSADDVSDDNQTSESKDESSCSNSSISNDNVNGSTNNEAEIASISSNKGAILTTTPVLRTNIVSSFFQREVKNDMLKSLKGKTRQCRAHQRYMNRTEELHRELLKCTANLLLLDESEAIALTPILMANHEDMDPSIVMEPFLQQLSSRDAAFNILVMVLFNFLLHSSEENEKISLRQSKNTDITIVGYDSRVRHVFKRLAVIILNVEDKTDQLEKKKEDDKFVAVDLKDRDGGDENDNTDNSNMNEGLIRKFENLEHAIASRLLLLSKLKKEEMERSKITTDNRSNGQGVGPNSGGAQLITWERPQVVLKDKLIRTASIVGAGLAAGAIFAVSGGLAAPGIAATVGMVAGSTVAATTAVVALTGTIAMSTIFGVSGAGLVAAKVGSRTRGLTEFVFKRDMQTRNQVELSRTVCVSGWIKSNNDFHRPWGITPEGLTKTEQLQRFFSIFDPEKVDKCDFILQQWKGREEQFWDLLRDTHGRDPDHLLPLYGPMDKAALNEDEHSAIDSLLETLGYPQLSRRADQMGRLSFDCDEGSDDENDQGDGGYDAGNMKQSSSFDGESSSPPDCRNNRRPISIIERGRPWDFHATFGGELYTVQWEPDLLLTLNDSMGIVGQEIAQTATLKVLQETALSSLASALSLPSNLMRFTRLIDGPWALCVKRADDAGIQLARSLLESTAGHRPVTLIGYGMGARMIYSCLKELAYHQEKWEDKREGKKDPQRRLNAAGDKKHSRRKINVPSWNFRVRRRHRDSKALEAESIKPILDTENQANIGSEVLAAKEESDKNNEQLEGEDMQYTCDELNGQFDGRQDKNEEVTIERTVKSDGDGVQFGEEMCDNNAEGNPIDRQIEVNDNPVDGNPPPISQSVSIDHHEEKEDEEEEKSVKYVREPASIVEDAILMGCPAYIHRPSWEACRRMVGGRLVNCYNPSDLILALMFQYECMSGLFRPTCGTYAVKVPGVENYNVSGLISAHSEYSVAVGEILQLIQHGEPVVTTTITTTTSGATGDLSRANSMAVEQEDDSSSDSEGEDEENESEDEDADELSSPIEDGATT